MTRVIKHAINVCFIPTFYKLCDCISYALIKIIAVSLNLKMCADGQRGSLIYLLFLHNLELLTYFFPSSLSLIWCDWVSGSVTPTPSVTWGQKPLFKPTGHFLQSKPKLLPVPGRIQFMRPLNYSRSFSPSTYCFIAHLTPNVACQLSPG